MKYPVTLNLVKIMEGRRGGTRVRGRYGGREAEKRDEEGLNDEPTKLNQCFSFRKHLCYLCKYLRNRKVEILSNFLFSYVSPVIILGYT